MTTNARIRAAMKIIAAEVNSEAEFSSGHRLHHVSCFLFDGAGYMGTISCGCECPGCLAAVNDAAAERAGLALPADRVAVH